MRLQVFSVYLGVDVRNYFLDTVFFIAFVWGCATAAVVFYGVDSVDREGGIDLKNRDNFQWLHVSQTFPKLYLLNCASFWPGRRVEGVLLVGAKDVRAYQG